MKYGVVVPVYKNEFSLPAVISRLDAIAGTLDGDLEVVFVVDGSPDSSAQVLTSLLPEASFTSRVLLHSRNFGSFAAIRTGLGASSADYRAVMAADLQEPPELITDFFRILASDQADVAIGKRVGRSDPGLSKLLSTIFWASYRKFVFKEMPKGGVDIFACSRTVAERIVELHESNTSLVGLLYWVGYRRAEVEYDRSVREHGVSAWTLRKKMRYLLDSIFAFSDLPLTLLTITGAAGAIVVVVLSAVVLGAYGLGAITETGYTPLMLVVLFSTFAIISALGIVGGYVWRAFENTKGRPSSIVMKSWDSPGREQHV